MSTACNLSKTASTFTAGSFATSIVILDAPGVKVLSVNQLEDNEVQEYISGGPQSLDLNLGSKV